MLENNQRQGDAMSYYVSILKFYFIKYYFLQQHAPERFIPPTAQHLFIFIY